MAKTASETVSTPTATNGVVDFSSLVITKTKSGYNSLKDVAGTPIIVKSLTKEDSSGATITDPAVKGTYVVTLDDGRKFFAPTSKAKIIDTALTLAKGNMVRLTIAANEKRGFTIK